MSGSSCSSSSGHRARPRTGQCRSRCRGLRRVLCGRGILGKHLSRLSSWTRLAECGTWLVDHTVGTEPVSDDALARPVLQDELDHPEPDPECRSDILCGAGLALARAEVHGNLHHAPIADDRQDHHLRGERVVPNRVMREESSHRGSGSKAHRAAHVRQRRCVEEHHDEFGDCQVAPTEEGSHVCAGPDELRHRLDPVDEVEVLGVCEQLPDIRRFEGRVRLTDAHEVRVGLGEPALNRSTVSLPGFEDLPGRRADDLLRCPRLGVVVDDHDVVDDPERFEALDDVPDRGFLAIRRKDDRDRAVIPHALPIPPRGARRDMPRVGARLRLRWVSASPLPHCLRAVFLVKPRGPAWSAHRRGP